MTASAGFDPVLVTGAGGFVGACVVRELARRGHAVHALVRPASQLWRLASVYDQLTCHSVDLTQTDEVTKVIRHVRPQAVLHLATHGAYEHQADADKILRVNVLGTCCLLEASAAAGVRVFVNAGSSSEYGFKSAPMRETDRLEPNSYYAIAKAAQTHLCQFAATQGTMAVAVLRLFSVYGPWEDPARLIPTLIRRARAGLPLDMAAPTIARDFVYVDDVVRGLTDLERLAEARGGVFNLGTGIQTSLGDVVRVVQAAVGGHSEVRWGAMPPRHWDTSCWQADASSAREGLAWSAQVGFTEGVARMAAWMQQHGDAYGPIACQAA